MGPQPLTMTTIGSPRLRTPAHRRVLARRIARAHHSTRRIIARLRGQPRAAA
ncbi:MAG: hypothetical protein L6Q83_05385 [Gammaproteobacteria bacterium]|nr:hypothetical protein [Gammaproteobacteria bacterium]